MLSIITHIIENPIQLYYECERVSNEYKNTQLTPPVEKWVPLPLSVIGKDMISSPDMVLFG